MPVKRHLADKAGYGAYHPGVQSVMTHVQRPVVATAMTASRIDGYLGTPTSVGAFKFTIWRSRGPAAIGQVTIAAAANTGNQTTLTNSDLALDDELYCIIDQIGTTGAGSDLSWRVR